MRYCVMSILPIAIIAIFLNSQVYAASNQFYVIKRGFRPSLLDWRLHVSPYFDTAKRVRPLQVVEQSPPRTEAPNARLKDLESVLQENMDLADEILFDLKSLLKDERRAGPGSRMIQRDMDEIDPDDPKRLLRIS